MAYQSNGAVEETRTLTPFGTAPSRRRVYQFHHDGDLRPLRKIKRYFGISPGFCGDSPAGAGAEGAGVAGTLTLGAAGASIDCVTPPDFDGAEKYVSPRLV